MATLGEHAHLLLEKAPLQVIFDAAATHLLEQGRKSGEWSDRNDSFTCRYDGYGGTCCAAGPFIKNYDPDMEHSDWRDLIVDYQQSNHAADLIISLQIGHDSYNPEEWPDLLRRIAIGFNLSPSVVENWEPK